MGMNEEKMKKVIFLLLFFVFVFFSFHFINLEEIKPNGSIRSSQLKRVSVKDDNTERIDYVDSNGIVTIAANLGYATIIKTKTEQGILERYYDNNGKAVSCNSGNYSTLREYDNKGNNTKNTFMDQEGNPYSISYGYAIEKRKYNEENRNIATWYYDEEGKPVRTRLYGYGAINEFGNNGLNNKITYINDSGKPMVTDQGYASVVRYYYLDDALNNGKVESEFYFDELGKPVALSLGQYGVHKEYNEFGQEIVLTYLNADGEPKNNNKGYATVCRTYADVYGIVTELYYDTEGEPVPLSEGQYGVKKNNGKEIYLNRNGKEMINLKQILYNQSWLVIVFALILIALSLLNDKQLNAILLVLYLGVIIYMTLMFRENIGTIVRIRLFWSFRQMLTEDEIRTSILKNVWLFVPLGTILSVLSQHKRILFISIVVSVVIEITQFISGTGYCDIDDVISNCIGTFIGFGTGNILYEWKQKTCKSNKSTKGC